MLGTFSCLIIGCGINATVIVFKFFAYHSWSNVRDKEICDWSSDSKF